MHRELRSKILYGRSGLHLIAAWHHLTSDNRLAIGGKTVNIKERLGLDFLKSPTEQSSAVARATGSADEYLEDAVLAFAGPVLGCP